MTPHTMAYYNGPHHVCMQDPCQRSTLRSMARFLQGAELHVYVARYLHSLAMSHTTWHDSCIERRTGTVYAYMQEIGHQG